VWPRGREDERQKLPLELADYLFKQGARAQAALELSSLVQQPQTSVAVKESAGDKLIAIHEPAQAARVFEELVRASPHDGNAWAGLGTAQFDSAEYQASEESLKNAELYGTTEDVEQRLRTAREILSLDPSLRGLRVGERVRRSAELLTQILSLASACQPQAGSAQELSRLVANAARQLKSNRPQNTETAAANVNLAGELWEANQKWCRTPASPALTLLMPSLLK
jgi:tetratricopeptide (TPR) repeat protein